MEALIETKPRRGDHVSSADFQWQRPFLAALRENCNVRAACDAAGVSRVMAYRTRQNDPAFAAAWQNAEEDAVDALEEIARSRALAGSDKLLMTLLAAHRPDKYGHRARVEHAGPNGAAIPLAVIDMILQEDAAQLPEPSE
jgi:hypothetical protein